MKNKHFSLWLRMAAGGLSGALYHYLCITSVMQCNLFYLSFFLSLFSVSVDLPPFIIIVIVIVIWDLRLLFDVLVSVSTS